MRRMLSVIMGMSLLVLSAASFQKKEVSAEDNVAAYLATYVASYEYNMGVEHAQFPSGNYTDNRRTDVLYYAVSLDGKNYKGLNNDKPVLYPKEMCQLGSPSIFRKADGTYGLIASINNNSDRIFLSDSDDLVTYYNDRTVTLNNKGIRVSNPVAEYDGASGVYHISWEGGDGNSYMSDTTDFTSFSEPALCDYKKAGVTGEFPSYAKEDEVSIIGLNSVEYDRIMKKYGEIKCIGIDGLSQTCKEGEAVGLPETLDVRYSDGSVTKMGVKWDTAGAGLDFAGAKAGTYKINGVVTGTTVYNRPVAEFRADPYILYNENDGYYYLTGSYMQKDLKNAYDYVIIRRAKTINELADAEEVRIFSGTTKAESGADVRPDYWAPEIHMIDGKYRIFVQGTVDGTSRQCILTCEDGDLLNPASWSYTGYIGDTTDGQQIGPFDTTYFEYKGQGYYVTQHTQGGSKLDITTVNPSDLTTPTGPRVSIAVPDRAYENNIGTGQSILEGPAALVHDGRVYVTYSGATIDMHYCTNLVYADLDSDLMDVDSWTKLQIPLLTTADLTATIKDSVLADGNGIYEGLMGPGHGNFTVDENGNVLYVYHARDWSESYAEGNDKYGLSDPGRHAYVKCVHFGADGFPILNMTEEQILPDNMRNVTMIINVTGNDVNKPSDNTEAPASGQGGSTDNNTGMIPDRATSDYNNIALKKSETVIGGIKYAVKTNSKGRREAEVKAAGNKKIKSAVIKSAVKISGIKYKVTGIAAGAFKNCKKLTKITIGTNVINIGSKAFYGCKNLKKITVKTKVLKKVGKNAFGSLGSFVAVSYPNKKAAMYRKMIAI